MTDAEKDLARMVRVRDLAPTVYVDLKYACDDNFMHRKIYEFEEAYLRYGTALRLARAQNFLLERGLSLKIWDAWRPLAAQFKMWEVYPVSGYVANPTNGGSSRHNRGSAVDVTLVTAAGAELPMPTAFDEFSAEPNREYDKYAPDAAANARLLEQAMEEAGFVPYEGEWWHFNDCDDYPVADGELLP